MNRLEYLMIDLPEDIKKTMYCGDFNESLRLIDIFLKRNMPQILKDRLIFEKDRIRRLKEDYIYSYEEALELAKNEIRNLTEEEFQYLKDERYIDWIYVDGKVTFHKSFLNNIIKVNTDMKHRFLHPRKDDSKLLDEVIDKIIEKGEVKYLIHVKTGLKLKEEHIRKGEKIRVHLPIPQNAQQIKNIRMLNTSHKPKYISREDYPQRTIYFEEILKGNDEFTVEYSYENHIKYNELSPDKVSSHQPGFYTEECLPQIRFTPYLVELTDMIAGSEKNPLIKARKIYDYITKNVQYSFVRQYAAITNIPEYAALNLKGDCGVQALLFITLCRIANIPSKWQSGLFINPNFIGCHDWAQFYIEPYGWLFADLSFGGSALRKGSEKRWNFYFGNLDPFRMVANSEFHYGLYPERKFLRHDPYDNQIGEMEYIDRPVYPHEYEVIQEIIGVREI